MVVPDQITFRAIVVVKGGDPVNLVRTIQYLYSKGIEFAQAIDVYIHSESLPVITIDLNRGNLEEKPKPT